MSAAEIPADEEERVGELRSLQLLDTAPEERFDQITRAAVHRFDVPIASVTLVDDDRQWFKSRHGLEATETPRAISFCAHAILGDDVFHVRDATVDPRFADNPLVEGEPGIRFYAGCPVTGPGGHRLGTLCIIDTKPRDLSPVDHASLRALATVVEQEIAAPPPGSVTAPEFRLRTIDCPTCGEPGSVLVRVRYRDGVPIGPPVPVTACCDWVANRTTPVVEARDDVDRIPEARHLTRLMVVAAIAFVAIILVALAIAR